MDTSKFETKVIFFRDSRAAKHHVIALRTYYVKGRVGPERGTAIDPLTRLFEEVGYGSGEVWLIRVIIPPPSRPPEIRFSERMEYWPSEIDKEAFLEKGGSLEQWDQYKKKFRYFYPDFQDLHYALQSHWDAFKSGQEITTQQVSNILGKTLREEEEEEKKPDDIE
jgi:hypothetical protein